MARKAKSDDLVMVAASGSSVQFEKDGDSCEGTFVGVEKNVGKNESNLYTFEDSKGNEFQVWGSASLDPSLSVAKKGERIRIIFRGRKKLGGGKQVKLFNVYGPKAFAERAQKVVLARMAQYGTKKKGRGKK